MRSRPRASRCSWFGCFVGDGGSVTAEFAMLIPSMVLILATFLGALNLQLERLQLVLLATDAARAAGRGDSVEPAVESETQFVTYARDELICVRVSKRAGAFQIKLEETICARANGR